MLRPKPKPLLMGHRTLIRHGELGYFSPNTMSKKFRYFFLFSDCLLLTKRLAQAKFQLQIYIHLRGNIKIVTLSGSPTYEFRLLVPEKGTIKKRKERRIILFGKSEEHKQAWLRDLQRCVWECHGKKGSDPSKGPLGDLNYDSDEEPSGGGRPKKAPEEEYDDEESYGSDSGEEPDEKGGRDDDHRVGKSGNDPDLVFFDPFGNESGKPTGGAGGTSGSDPFGLGFDPTVHQGVDPHGQAVPKGVMLPPLDQQGSPYSHSTAPPPYGGVGAYGTAGVGPASPYGHTASPYDAYSPVTSGLAQPGFGAGGTGFGAGGVAPLGGTQGMDRSALYGAAAGTTTALGGMFETGQLGTGGQSGLGGGSSGTIGLGGVGASGSGGTGTAPTPVYAGPDLDAVAQKELQDATRAIEAIALELASRRRLVPEAQIGPDMPLTMDHVSDAILDGAGAIAKASAALLKATAAAQQERVDNDKLMAHQKGGQPYHADPIWANGLISAGRNVVGSTQFLVSTANLAVQGQAKEESLIAAAKNVAASTAQLVAAERAKGNIHGAAHSQLEKAADGIGKATQQLVEAAQLQSKALQAEQYRPKPQADNTQYSLTETKKKQLEAQARVLELEKQTQQAREELFKLRQQEYKKGQ